MATILQQAIKMSGNASSPLDTLRSCMFAVGFATTSFVFGFPRKWITPVAFRTVALVISGALSFNMDLAGQQSNDNWSGFLGPTQNGKSLQTNIKSDWSDGKLELLWSKPLGEGYGIGSLANGRFYQADREKNQLNLFCFDSNTGEEIWKFSYTTDYEDMYGFDGGPRSSPVVDEGRVYLYGPEGLLHCLSTVDKSVRWTVDTEKRFGVVQNFFGVGSSPIVYDDKLIVIVGGSPDESQKVQKGALNLVKPNGSAIIAFDKMTGEVIYKTGNDLASYASPIICKINGHIRGLAFCRKKLLLFDPADGTINDEFDWHAKKLESVNASSAVCFGDSVFITESYGPGAAMLKVVDDKFELAWKDEGRKQSLQSHWATPIEIDGYLYGSQGQHRATAELRCVDAKTGEVQWSQLGLDRSSLTLVEGYLVCLSETGGLNLIRPNPERFELVSTFQPAEDVPDLEYPCWSAPVVADGKMFVRSKDRVFCFEIVEKSK